MVDVADAAVLAVLTRAPSSGGKTRLFADLGRVPDRRLLEALLLDTIERAAPTGVRRVIVVTPGSACAEVQELAPGVDVIPQAEGDLGERMHAAMVHLFERGARSVAVIGSDLPDITPDSVAAAFEALESDPEALVLGPAADGGYYLVAARRVPDIFTGIEWGSARAMEQTERLAMAQGFRVRRITAMSDVDTADDLRRAAGGTPAPRRTAAWVREFLTD
jgi:rSAM/selenodomain-associated transferase 1